MKFAYTIIYVANVAETVAFYEAAFGLTCRMMHESDQYSEMETGSTVLAFAHESMADSSGFSIAPNRAGNAAAGIEIAFVSDDVSVAYAEAVDAGATPVTPPERKPWGQDVSYVRDLNGVLVEICSEITGWPNV